MSTRPLNRVKGISLKKLLDKAAALSLSEDETATLASRLAKLEMDLTPAEREELDSVAGWPMRELVRGLVDAVDPDKQAQAAACTADPAAAAQQVLDEAIRPLAANPELRNRILELRATHDRVIDEVNADELIEAGGASLTPVVPDPSWTPGRLISTSTAMRSLPSNCSAKPMNDESRSQTSRNSPTGSAAPPAQLDHRHYLERLRSALCPPRVRHSDRHTLTDLVSLLRYTVGVDAELVPYADRVRERYGGWLAQQKMRGIEFSPNQRWWLDRMVEVIAVSAGISVADLDAAPFNERGGVDGALRDLGDRTSDLLNELNTELTA